MKTNKVRDRVATGCFLTMLLSAAEPLVARSADVPRFDLCAVERDRAAALTFGTPRDLFFPARAASSADLAPAPLDSSNAMAPWFRRTLVPFRADGICRIEAAVEAASAEAKVEVAEVKPPGVVQNLRRTDRP